MARFLVVDDEPRGVELLVRALRPLGEVVGAADGEEAWRRFEESPFDVVVSDQRMPGLTGVELLGRVAARDELVGRILLTGFADVADTIDAINRARVHAYLSKPCPPAQLQATVRAVLVRARVAREGRDAALAASQAKGEFLANISHELRTPLTAILGYSELLGGELSEGDHADAIRTIRSQGQHLLRLVDDVLDLSRSEGAAVVLAREMVLLDSLLAELGAAIAPSARERGLDLALVRDPVAPATLTTDGGRLRQILHHLLENAVRFTERGEVRLEVRAARLGECYAVEFAVRDTGPGMSAEEQLRIFRPFTQLDASATRRTGGAGLGLVLARRLTELLGGALALESAPGAGSTFRVTLPSGDAPRASSPAAPTRPTAHDSTALRGTRVLYAEDSPDNQRLIAALLRRAGASVELAPNGRDAVLRALSARELGEPFHVLLMDMQMPVLDGYEATRVLRGRGYSLPIVAVTAHALAEHREECLAAGCDDYLSQPIDRERLVETVGRLAAKAGRAGE